MFRLKLFINCVFAVLFISAFLSCKKEDGGPITGSVKDNEGNEYLTVVIQDQEWISENLRVSKYNNGSSIPHVQNMEEWAKLESGAWCYHSDDDGKVYGKLYNWYAVNDKRGICPKGWHVPTDKEWNIMINEFKGIHLAGGKLKSTATVPDDHPRWINPNANATDEIEFSAVPGGIRTPDGEFKFLGSFGAYWTNSETHGENAWKYGMSYNDSKIYRHRRDKNYGYSVRCVRSTEGID